MNVGQAVGSLYSVLMLLAQTADIVGHRSDARRRRAGVSLYSVLRVPGALPPLNVENVKISPRFARRYMFFHVMIYYESP